jgi:hypothetical protein
MLLKAATIKGLKVVKSLTEQIDGTQSPKAIGMGRALGIEIRI